MKLLLEHGANINRITEETQETACRVLSVPINDHSSRFFSRLVTLTCAAGFIDVVKILLDHGAQINAGQLSPLMEASQEGHLEIVQYLLAMKADVHQRTPTGDSGRSSFFQDNEHLNEC